MNKTYYDYKNFNIDQAKAEHKECMDRAALALLRGDSASFEKYFNLAFEIDNRINDYEKYEKIFKVLHK